MRCCKIEAAFTIKVAMQFSRDDVDSNHKRQQKIVTTILKEENLLSRAPVLLEIKEQKVPPKGSGQDLEAR